ncbi:MAG: hypothetical protein BYD32DRAFT_481477 [Podila humilis]|nr:MAG: hypothetical protein BYD32DRAFT_481477 [Podila humilis]
MKFTLPLAAALSVFSIASAAPLPGVPGLDALGGLLGPVTQTLGGLGKAAGGPQAQAALAPAPAAESLPPFGSSPSTDISEPSFEKRATESHVESVIDAIVKINTDAVAKVLVKLKADICADLHSKLHLTATGILTTDTDVNVPEASAKLESETNLAVHTKVDADAKLLVTSKIHAHAESALLKHCPLGDDKCIIELAADIAASIESAVKIDVDHLFTALRANLLTYVRAKVEVVVHDLGLNLFVEQIHIAGFVDATAEVNVLLESCYHVIVHALNVTIVANAAAVIKALLSV